MLNRLQTLVQATTFALPPKLYGLREKELRSPGGPLGPVHVLGLRWPRVLVVETEDFAVESGEAPLGESIRREHLQLSYEHLLALGRFLGNTPSFPYSGALPPIPRQVIAALVVTEKPGGMALPSFEEGPLRFAGLFDEREFETWLGMLGR